MGCLYGGSGFWWTILKGAYFVFGCFVFSWIFWKMKVLVEEGCCKRGSKTEAKKKRK